MSTPINDGGPAFPLGEADHGTGMRWAEPGMTLRDYFAAKFGHAELMTCGVPGAACDALIEAIGCTGETVEDHIARCAYDLADAMLRAREVQP